MTPNDAPLTALLKDGPGAGFEFTVAGPPKRVYFVDGRVAYAAPADTSTLIRSEYALVSFADDDDPAAVYEYVADEDQPNGTQQQRASALLTASPRPIV